MYNELLQLIRRKIPQSNKWAEKLNITFSKENRNNQLVHEKLLTSLITWEMQTQTIIRYHFTPVSMSLIKKEITNIGKDIQ